MNLQPIEKREGLDRSVFQREYHQLRQPVVFKDLASDWPAVEKWTFEWLKEHYGHIEVPLYGSDFREPGKNYMVPKLRLRFGEYLDLIQAGPTEYRMFLFNIFEHAPELTADFSFPTIMNGFAKKHPFLFFGGQGARVDLHYDIDCSSVFLTQFQTRKRVVLFAPDQSKYLYQHPFTVQSQMDVDRPDYHRFPAFKKATGFETMLQHGETLYIPSGYWHYIEYVDSGYSISLRANDALATRVQGLVNLAQHFLVDKGMNLLLGPRWKKWKEDTAVRRALT